MPSQTPETVEADWAKTYEESFRKANNRPCAVAHVGGGWYVIADGFTHESFCEDGATDIGHYRKKDIIEMTERLKGRF